MASTRRIRGLRRVLFGPGRGSGVQRRWPAAEDIPRRSRSRGPFPDDLDGPSRPPRDPGPPGTEDPGGGAGVREPRRPSPTFPSAAAEYEPEPPTFLDLGEAAAPTRDTSSRSAG